MKFTISAGAGSLALAASILVAMPAQAWAGAADYEFQLVESTIRQGDGAVVAVRLVDKRSGQAVPDAVIFATRIDMAPDGMETMTTPVEAMPSDEPGVYRFKTNLTMAGRLAAFSRCQGPGRDRDGRKQAGPEGGAVMRRTACAARPRGHSAAGAGGYWAGQHDFRVARPGDVRTRPRSRRRRRPRRHGSDHLLPPSGRQAVYSAHRERRTRPGISRRPCQRGSELRSGGGQSSGCGGEPFLGAHHSLLPQSDGPARHLPGAEEGFDGDGLHPRL